MTIERKALLFFREYAAQAVRNGNEDYVSVLNDIDEALLGKRATSDAA